MSDNDVGHAVVDGVVRHFSVSSLEKAAPREAGCLRRWWYRYVGGKSAEENAKYQTQKKLGEDLHAEIARYLRTGEMALSAIAMRGLHMVPTPGPDLLVERSLHSIVDGRIVSPLTAAGIPLIGFVDLVHDRCLNYGADDPADARDPPGTVEVCDWKRKGNATTREGLSTLKRPDELSKTIQMAGYGTWIGGLVKPERVRLSHGYFVERGGASRKVTKLHVVDDCLRTWEYVEGVARSVTHVARETIVEKVDPNTSACQMYGGCPHAGYCKAANATSLSNLFGETATADLKKEIHMGLIDQLAAHVAPPAAPDQRASLLEEEARLRAAQPAQQAPPPMAVHPFAAAWARIEAHGRGTPQLGGPAAKAYADACGVQLNGAGFAGTGEIGRLPIFEPAQISQLADEMDAKYGAKIAPPPAPVVVAVQHVHAGDNTIYPVAPSGGILPPDAPASIPALASAPDKPTAEPTAAKRGRGRPKASPAPVAAAIAVPLVPAASRAGAGTSPSDTEPAVLEVFVDCVPSGPYRSLHEYVDQVCAALAKRYCVNDDGSRTIDDLRCAPANGVLGFGRWKGAVRATVRECPPPPDTYVLMARGNEVAAEVADAMRQVCAERNALYVRGV